MREEFVTFFEKKVTPKNFLGKGIAPAGTAPTSRAHHGPREDIILKNPLFKDFCRAFCKKLAAGGIRVLSDKSKFEVIVKECPFLTVKNVRNGLFFLLFLVFVRFMRLLAEIHIKEIKNLCKML